MDEIPNLEQQTFLTVRQAVLEIRADVKTLAAHLNTIDREGSIGTKAELTDHEGRLRSLERFRYALPTSATLAGIAALAATIFSFFH